MPIFIFLSEIFILAIIWMFIVEFNENFDNKKNLEDISFQKILNNKYYSELS